MDINTRVVELREKSNMKLTELAKIAGLSQSYLSQIEHNERKCPIDTLEKICNALNITLSEFFNVDNEIDLNMNALVNELKQLEPNELEAIKNIAHILNEKNKFINNLYKESNHE